MTRRARTRAPEPRGADEDAVELAAAEDVEPDPLAERVDLPAVGVALEDRVEEPEARRALAVAAAEEDGAGAGAEERQLAG